MALVLQPASLSAQQAPSSVGFLEITPDGGSAIVVANSTGNVVFFDAVNKSASTGVWTFTCSATGNVACTSVAPTSQTLAPGQETVVRVTYRANAAGTGRITLTSSGETGYYNITVQAAPVPPAVAIVAPVLTTGSRSVVRTRQPLIRAFFTPSGAAIDTAATVLQWRGVTVTGLARHNGRLLEWEVDSTRWLNVGDSAQAVVTACSVGGGCTTVSRWVVLENDQRPVLGFTGMPLEALGTGFSAPLGLGVSVRRAEVEAGLGIPSYVSMGAPRSAGLVYSTRQSYPRALVNVDLELPWPAGTADQVKLVLLDGASRLDSLVLASPTCATGAVKRCRATLQGDFAAGSFPTPVRKWLTVEASVTSSGTTKMGSDSVEVVLVDRRATRYGSGWWPSGIAQLVGAGSDRVLVGASGTATVYRGNADSSYVPPPGIFTALVRTSTGWELQPRGSLAKLIFDASGRQVVAVDQNGNRDSIAYSGSTDQVTAVLDPVGKAITFGYNASAKLATLTDPSGRQTKVTINNSTNQLTTDSLVAANRPANAKYVYRTYPGSFTTVLLKRIGRIADTTQLIYDSTFKRRPTQVKLPAVEDQTGASVKPTVTYTAAEGRGVGGFVALDQAYVEMKDPRNNWTRSLLNRWGQARKVWDAVGTISNASYDPDGALLWSEGKSGDSSRVYQAYDAARRLVKRYIIRGGGGVLRLDSLTYDANHRVVKRIDARGQIDSVTYDSRGNVIGAVDPAGFASRIVYRADGLVDSAAAPAQVKYQKFTYDPIWKNVAQVTDEGNQVVVQNAYDGLGRDTTSDRKIRVQLTSTTTQWQWRRTRTRYTVTNQADTTMLVKSANCADPCTTSPGWLLTKLSNVMRVSRQFDKAGRDSLRRNELGVATVYLYDRLGRLVSRRPWADSAAVVDSMVYDVAGNLKKTITRRGDVITTDYDSRNRDTLTFIPGVGTLRKAFGGPLDQITRMWYDAPVDSIGGVNAELRWTYDTRGRLRADTSYSSRAERTTYTYNAFEELSGWTDVLGSASVGYDAVRGFPDTLINAYQDTVTVTLDGRGNLGTVNTRVGGAGSQSRSYGWNSQANLTSLTHSTGGASPFNPGSFDLIDDFDYPGGPSLLPSWRQQRGSGAAVETLQDSVIYDGWQRVVGWSGLKNGAVVAHESYTFDRAGNIGTLAEAQVYDSVTSRLLQQQVSGVLATSTYDRAGNLTQVVRGTETWVYAYDALNRLRSARRNGVVIARYGYDVLGRRIGKRVYSAASGGTVGYTRFVYHGDAIAVEADSGGTYGLRYTWGPGSDKLGVVRDAAGAEYVPVLDKLGSIRGLTRKDGAWWMSQRFGPYGAVVARDTTTAGAAVKLRYGWTGREYDAETGFYYFRSRYYGITQRRFVQEDALGYAGGANLYAYVDGDVLESADPDGTMKMPADRLAGAGGSERAGDWWSDFSYANMGDLAVAREMAEYEAWLAAGSESRDGERVLATETAEEFVNRVLGEVYAPDFLDAPTTHYQQSHAPAAPDFANQGTLARYASFQGGLPSGAFIYKSEAWKQVGLPEIDYVTTAVNSKHLVSWQMELVRTSNTFSLWGVRFNTSTGYYKGTYMDPAHGAVANAFGIVMYDYGIAIFIAGAPR